jgi:hypothetical protein
MILAAAKQALHSGDHRRIRRVRSDRNAAPDTWQRNLSRAKPVRFP